MDHSTSVQKSTKISINDVESRSKTYPYLGPTSKQDLGPMAKKQSTNQELRWAPDEYGKKTFTNSDG